MIAAPPGAAVRVPPPCSTGPAMEPPRTILLIDGDEDSQSIFATILRYHGYRVLGALDDETGYQLACDERPDLIVCDPFRQRVRGKRLAEQLRESPVTAGIPVLVLSAVPQHASRIGLAAAALLEKPCKPERVVREVGLHLQAPPALTM
jgi:two-component system cell cycle response regulator DivK